MSIHQVRRKVMHMNVLKSNVIYNSSIYADECVHKTEAHVGVWHELCSIA